MSYDIYLKDQASGDTIQLDTPHIMTGGIYAAIYDEDRNAFYKKPITDAWLNITYNYSRYYYEAAESDERFFAMNEYREYVNLGIRAIYGKSGAESIPMLNDMINRIKFKYQSDGNWIINPRKRIRYYDKDGKEIDIYDAIINHIDYQKREVVEDVYEGTNDDYWAETAGNAIRPLYQLLAFAKLRPDGIWDGD